MIRVGGVRDSSEELQKSFREYSSRRLPREKVRQVLTAERVGSETWGQVVAELGVHALALPESMGGMLVSSVDILAVAHEVGRSICPIPFSEVAAGSGMVLAGVQDADSDVDGLRCALLEGEIIIAVPTETLTLKDGVIVSGKSLPTRYGEIATRVLVQHGVDILVIATNDAGVQVVPKDQFDAADPVGVLEFDGADFKRIATAPEGFLESIVRSHYALALAAEAIGAAGGSLDMAVEYMGIREQFGKVIGSFQGLKHQAADAFVNLESYAAGLGALGLSLDFGDSLEDVLGYARDAVRVAVQVAETSIQLLGGIGFTWEHDAHLYLRKVLQIRSLLVRL